MTPSAAHDDPRWCPFCNPDPQRVFLRLRHVFVLWDGFPVTDGLALIVPYRHVPTWFEASNIGRAELSQSRNTSPFRSRYSIAPRSSAASNDWK